MIEQVTSILYTITAALKVPVITGLLLALLWSLYEIGMFLREWLERRTNRYIWNQQLSDFCKSAPASRISLNQLLSSIAAPYLLQQTSLIMAKQKTHCEAILLEQVLQEIEFNAAKRLARIRIGLRIGPMLGLMGTLIPMGPALMSISQGNLGMMSQELIIVFSTTVAGLVVGALCYVMLIIRQYWYARDMMQTEQLTRYIVQGPIGVVKNAVVSAGNASVSYNKDKRQV